MHHDCAAPGELCMDKEIMERCLKTCAVPQGYSAVPID